MRNINLIASGALGFNFVEFCIWSGAFALMLMLTFIVVMRLRKLVRNDGTTESESALTIEQLEEMHVKGMISDEEFATMRRCILGIGTPKEKSAKSEDAI